MLLDVASSYGTVARNCLMLPDIAKMLLKVTQLLLSDAGCCSNVARKCITVA